MKEIDWPLFIYWLAMYGFCIASLIALNISKARPGYFLMGIVFMAFTLYLAAMDICTSSQRQGFNIVSSSYLRQKVRAQNARKLVLSGLSALDRDERFADY
jgi:hypothetical protein